MKARKQHGLPSGPPYVGKDELLLDAATGVLHGRAASGAIVPVVGYKSYVAQMTQASTDDPVAVVLRNDFDETPAWTYEDVGEYSLLFGAPVLTTGKAVVSSTSNSAVRVVHPKVEDPQSVSVICMDYVATKADVNEFLLEIRVYA